MASIMFKPDYLFRNHPQPGQRWQVADGVHWLHFPLPMALNHVNVWLLDDADGWLLVDTGLGSTASRELWDTVIDSVLDGKPIRRIVVTHYHADHIGLAGWLARRFDAEVLITHAEWSAAQQLHGCSDADCDHRYRQLLSAHGLHGADLEAAAGGGNGYRRIVAELPPSAQFIAAGEALTIGGREWRVHIGHGHAPEHACLYRADDQLLVAGDQVLPRISSNLSVSPEEPDTDLICPFLESLQALKTALPADTLVLPGHGRPFRGLGERVDDLHRHHRRQLDAVERACRDQPQTACQLLPVLFQRELNGFQMMLAMGEAIAHLNCLRAHGRAHGAFHGGCWHFRSSMDNRAAGRDDEERDKENIEAAKPVRACR